MTARSSASLARDLIAISGSSIVETLCSEDRSLEAGSVEVAKANAVEVELLYTNQFEPSTGGIAYLCSICDAS